MSKFLIPLLAVLFFTSCEQEEINKLVKTEMTESPLEVVELTPYLEQVADNTLVSTKKDVVPFERKIKIPELDNVAPKNAEKFISRTYKPNYEALDRFFEQFGPKKQAFVIDPTVNNKLKLDQGTIIDIPSSAFLSASGAVVSQKVLFTAQEFYDKASFILGKLSTQTNNDLIESGGMLFLQAKSNGEELTLDETKPIEVSLPTNNYKADMTSFYGKKNSNGVVKWNLGKESKSSVKSKMKRHLNLIEKSYKISLANQKNQILAEEELVSESDLEGYSSRIRTGSAKVELMLNRRGKILSKRLLERKGSARGGKISAAWWSVTTSNAYEKYKGERKSTTLGYHKGSRGDFYLNIKEVMNHKLIRAKHIKDRKFRVIVEFETLEGPNLHKFLNQVRSSELSGSKNISERQLYHKLSFTQLGWINCDRFTDSPSPKVDMIVKNSSRYATANMLVFTDINSVLNAYNKTKQSVFKNIPKEAKGKIVSLQMRDDGAYVSVSPVEVQKGHFDTNFQYKKVKASELSAYLNSELQ